MINSHSAVENTTAQIDPACKLLRFSVCWPSSEEAVGLLDQLLQRTRSVDLDATAVLLDATGGLLDQVWFGRLRTLDDSVQHKGDRTGNPTAQQNGMLREDIDIFLSKIPESVTTIWLAVCSYQGHAFAELPQAYCRLIDPQADTDQALINVALADYADNTALLVAGLLRNAEGWQLLRKQQPLAAKNAELLAHELAEWSVGQAKS